MVSADLISLDEVLENLGDIHDKNMARFLEIIYDRVYVSDFFSIAIVELSKDELNSLDKIISNKRLFNLLGKFCTLLGISFVTYASYGWLCLDEQPNIELTSCLISTKVRLKCVPVLLFPILLSYIIHLFCSSASLTHTALKLSSLILIYLTFALCCNVVSRFIDLYSYEDIKNSVYKVKEVL